MDVLIQPKLYPKQLMDICCPVDYLRAITGSAICTQAAYFSFEGVISHVVGGEFFAFCRVLWVPMTVAVANDYLLLAI